MYSGECDWPFKVRVVGITNIHRLLILDDKDHPQLRTVQDQKKRASYNGLCPPRYLTKASAKNEESHNTSKKKVVKAEDDFQKEKKAFLRF